MLAIEGWKYFDVKNLNEFFSVMLEQHGIKECVVEKIDEAHVTEEESKCPATAKDVKEERKGECTPLTEELTPNNKKHLLITPTFAA